MPANSRFARIEELEGELRLLRRQQTEAFQASVLLPMTPVEAKAYEDRRVKIAKLVNDLKDEYYW